MTQVAGLPLENTHQPPTNRFRRGLLVGLAVLSLALWLGVIWELVYLVPKFREEFRLAGMRIPLLAEFVINHFWWFVPAYTALALLVCIGLMCFRRESRWGWFSLLLLLPVLYNVFMFAILWIPYAQMIEAVTRRPANVWTFLWK